MWPAGLLAIEQLDRTTAGRLSSSARARLCRGVWHGGRRRRAARIDRISGQNHGLHADCSWRCGLLHLCVLGCGRFELVDAEHFDRAETLPGDEWIGVFMFVLKAILRLAPVAFGAGVICGTLAMGFACYLACVGETGTAGAAEASYRAPLVMADGFWCVPRFCRWSRTFSSCSPTL